jgi:CO/xanthine dehydrogenase FAD-binding subunit
VPVRDFFVADGVANTRRAPDEILIEVRVPLASAGRRTAYAKLRQRQAIDFPLLTVAVSADLDESGVVRSMGGVVTGLGSRPRELAGWGEAAAGRPLDDELLDDLAERAHKQCHPLENMIADPEWRRAMVPVYVRRALERLREA